MTERARTLGFGETFDMAVVENADGQLLTLTSHRGHDEHPPHKHSNDYLCIVLAGGFAELERNVWRERRSGCFFAHRAGETHHDHIGPRGAMCLNLHFACEDTAPLGLEGMCSPVTKVTADRLAFELAARLRDDLVMAALAAEIMAQVSPAGRALPDAGRWVDTLIEAISDEPCRRWSLGELARLAGRHPVHVAQAFRARTGTSLGGYQRLRRLTSLGVALRQGQLPLAALAQEFGYCDQSHMNSEFRAAFGISPGRYRREFH
jgi:AraC family transcriptional regulator